MRKKFIGERTLGFLFRLKNGSPLLQTKVLRLSLHPLLERVGQPKSSAHAFRLFRATWLRKQRLTITGGITEGSEALRSPMCMTADERNY
jgi:hypothetical protein